MTAAELQALAVDPVDPLSAEGLAGYYDALIGARLGRSEAP